MESSHDVKHINESYISRSRIYIINIKNESQPGNLDCISIILNIYEQLK